MFKKNLTDFTIKVIKTVAEAKSDSKCVGFLYEPKKPLSFGKKRKEKQ